MVTWNATACSLLTVFIAFLLMQRFEFARGSIDTSYSNKTSCFKSEKNALLKFKRGLTDMSNILSSWTGEECCIWAGIHCSRRTRHVVKLDLRTSFKNYNYWDGRHTFIGEISNSLRNLKHLTHLDLSMNEFSATEIPAFIGSLVNLRYLNLSSSSFTGKVPHNLGNLTRLKYLDLSNNYMLTIDSLWWVSQLYSLEHLDLSNANLSKATSWFPAINMLPSLLVLNLRMCNLDLNNIPAYASINFTSLVSLDLNNNFQDLNYNFQATVTPVPYWLSNITGLVKLNLGFNSYAGPIPEYFGTLQSLTFLDLQQNLLEGPIPSEMSNLTQLKHLILHGNRLTGNLPPSFEKLSFLRILDISLNLLSGTIPPFIGQLSELEILDVGGNQFGGTIPHFIGQLSKLEKLVIGRNKMSGIISENYFKNHTRLTYLDLSSNIGVITDFSSTWSPPFQLKFLRLSSCKVGPRFPHWLRNQGNLNELHLYNASIAGNIPHWFSSLSVQTLDLSENKLNGNLVLNYSNLVDLDISGNLLSGLMASNATDSLWWLYASNNLLTGAFPAWLCSTKFISIIDLSHNHLSGRLPTCLGNLGNLLLLDLTNNSFSGSIPEFLGSQNFLTYLHLHNNKFEGDLPTSFRNLTQLYTLDVGENAITGIIPPWIGETLSNLMVLSLQSNRFHGPIPKQLCQLSYLQILNLALNNLSGSIPSCFGNLTAMISDQYLSTHFGWDKIFEIVHSVERLYKTYLLISMDLSDNNITGVIPVELMELLRLVKLNVSGNHIDGRIPDQIGNLRQLLSLDLSRNKLSGPIPQSLSSLLSLESLNLSFNDLWGKIPTGQQLQTFNDPSIYMGNKRLCGAPLNLCNVEHDSSDHTRNEEPDNNEDDSIVDVWFYSGMGPGFSVGILGFCGSVHYNKRWRYAYYRFLENVYNTLAVAIAVKKIQLWRKFQKHETEG